MRKKSLLLSIYMMLCFGTLSLAQNKINQYLINHFCLIRFVKNYCKLKNRCRQIDLGLNLLNQTLYCNKKVKFIQTIFNEILERNKTNDLYWFTSIKSNILKNIENIGNRNVFILCKSLFVNSHFLLVIFMRKWAPALLEPNILFLPK